MWYYIKDSKPSGPVADSAILNMYRRGEIGLSTLVRTDGEDSWRHFESTRFYAKIIGRRSLHAETLSIRTAAARGFLTAYIVVVCASFFLDFQIFGRFSSIISGTGLSERRLDMIKSDYLTCSGLAGTIILAVFAASLYFLMKWVKNVTYNARMLDKRFDFSPGFAAWSLLFPLVNLIHPFTVLSAVYRTSKAAAGRRYTICDASFLFLWWFFTMFSLLVFVIDKWMLKAAMTMEKAKAILVFNMYAVLIYAAAALFWIILIGAVYRFQKAAFSEGGV